LLRLRTVELIATIELLLDGWFEPPPSASPHFSTLVQQILACIAQSGGCRAQELYRWLCAPGAAFSAVTADDFKMLLRHLGTKDLLMQDSDGTLLHGSTGEQMANHYTFYAAFASDVEYRLVAGHRTLGTLPMDQILRPGQRILFAGRTWKIESIEDATKTIFVVQQAGGKPPLFSYRSSAVHGRVRERMREIYLDDRLPKYLDAGAAHLLGQGRDAFRQFKLDELSLIEMGGGAILAVWASDAVVEGLCALLRWLGVDATHDGPLIEVSADALRGVAAEDLLSDLARAELPDLDAMLADAANLEREKWDAWVPHHLLCKGLEGRHLDLVGAKDWRTQFAKGVDARDARAGSRV
jgi:ATP-dependent helicase Lhr and Lhr-like helicase